MTKSEARLRIAKILNGNGYASFGQLKKAEEILKELKAIGMKPPKWTGKCAGQFPGDEHEFEMECWEEDYYGGDEAP
jgi:hypothetical protein